MRRTKYPSHPYIANAYPGANDAVERFMQSRSRQKKDEPETFETCPTERGKVRVSSKHGKNELRENIRVAIYLANKHGYEIDIIANPNNAKSADSFNKTLGIYQEYKTHSTPTRNSLDMLIKKGKKQADHLVISLESGMSLGEAKEVVIDRVRRSDNLMSITFVYEGKDATYTREQMTDSSFEIKREDFK